MDIPAKGDIWSQDDGDYYLFLSEPTYVEDEIIVNAMHLNSGIIVLHHFGIDPKTGTLYEWWTKVA